MLFSYNWLQEFFKAKLPTPEKLADLLAMHVFEVEGIEKLNDDSLLDISILPQRGDCLSHYGIAREISAIINEPFAAVETMPLKVQKGELKPLKISLSSVLQFVPRYSAVVVEGVTLGPSPQWMQERLALLGVNSINNVVDITNYVMLELGQPMHAFDYQKIRGQKMQLRLAKTDEKIKVLDESELLLPSGTLVCEDVEGLIDLVGIKGGKQSGIGSQTKDIIFQAAIFDRKKIYQTKKALGYSTAAADMYSHDLDAHGTVRALERALFLLSKFGGGKVVQSIDFFHDRQLPKFIAFSSARVEKLLGVKIPQTEIKNILDRLGFQTAGNRAKVPSFRTDVSIPEDLVEEVGRIYGYDKVPATFPAAAIEPPEFNFPLYWKQEIQNALKEAGYTEVYDYSFIPKAGADDTAKLVELENPISEEFEYLRPNVLSEMVNDIAKNQKVFGQKDMRIFQLGTVFIKTSKGIRERKKLGIVFSPASLAGRPAAGNEAFYELKGVFEFVLSRLGITDVRYEENKKYAKSATVFISQTKEVGNLYEVPGTQNSPLKLNRQVVALEVDFDTICEDAFEEREYVPPSKYPALLRDIALLVPREVKVEDVLNVMEEAGGKLVADIDLFDMYEGDELPDEKKNLAFHIVYQAKDKTLTNQEADALQIKIVKALEQNEEWEVRD